MIGQTTQRTVGHQEEMAKWKEKEKAYKKLLKMYKEYERVGKLDAFFGNLRFKAGLRIASFDVYDVCDDESRNPIDQLPDFLTNPDYVFPITRGILCIPVLFTYAIPKAAVYTFAAKIEDKSCHKYYRLRDEIKEYKKTLEEVYGKEE